MLSNKNQQAKMVYESGYKSQNAFAAVSRKETGYVVDPAGR